MHDYLINLAGDLGHSGYLVILQVVAWLVLSLTAVDILRRSRCRKV
jgi:hypothetical protein